MGWIVFNQKEEDHDNGCNSKPNDTSLMGCLLLQKKISSHDSRANPTTAFRNFYNNALAVWLDLGCSESHMLQPETKNIAPLRLFYPEFSYSVSEPSCQSHHLGFFAFALLLLHLE